MISVCLIVLRTAVPVMMVLRRFYTYIYVCIYINIYIFIYNFFYCHPCVLGSKFVHSQKRMTKYKLQINPVNKPAPKGHLILTKEHTFCMFEKLMYWWECSSVGFLLSPKVKAMTVLYVEQPGRTDWNGQCNSLPENLWILQLIIQSWEAVSCLGSYLANEFWIFSQFLLNLITGLSPLWWFI